MDYQQKKKKLNKLILLISPSILLSFDYTKCDIQIKKVYINEVYKNESFIYKCKNNLYIESKLFNSILKKNIIDNYSTKIDNIKYINIKKIPYTSYHNKHSYIDITIKNNKLFNNKYLEYIKKSINKKNTSLNGVKFSYDINTNFKKNEIDSDLILNNQSELLIFTKHGFLSNNFITSTEKDKSFIRLDSYYQYDLVNSMNTIIVGDTSTTPGEWSNSFRFGGFKLMKNFKLKPEFIRYPLPDLSISSVVPTSFDLYINEVQKIGKNIEPGNYFIDYMPNLKGGNNIKIETTDIFGRKKEVELNFYSSTNLLRSGVSDYSIEFGKLRKNFGIKNFDYEDYIFNYTYSYGFTNTLTVETSGYYLDSGYPGLTLKKSLKDLLLTGTIAISLKKPEDSLIKFSAETANQKYSIKWIYETSDESFYENEKTNYAKSKYGIVSRYNINDFFGSLSGSYFQNKIFDKNENKILKQEVLTINYNKVFNKKYMFNINFIRNIDITNDNDEFYIGTTLNIPLYEVSKNTYLISKSSNEDSGFSLNKSKDNTKNIGNSYKFLYNGDYEQNYNINIDLSQYNQYNITSQSVYYNSDNNLRIDMNVKGDITFAKNKIFFSQPVSGSFGIIEVENTKNVNIFNNNNIAGKTDENGFVFINNLTPYYLNKIDIKPTDIPFNKELLSQSTTLKPYYKNGAYYKFKYKYVLPSYITVKNNNIKTGDDVIVYNKNKNIIEKTIVGEDGIIFFNNLNIGKNIVEIITESERISFEVLFKPKNKEEGLYFIGEYSPN